LEVDRDVPKLLALPAAVHFLSIEPILGPIDLRRYFTPTGVQCPDECQDTRYVLETEVDTYTVGSEINPRCPQCGEHAGWTGYDSALDWVVVGGESGHQARPMHPTWLRSLRDQCRVAAVPFLFKQWGEWSELANESTTRTAARRDTRTPGSMVLLASMAVVGSSTRKACGQTILDPLARKTVSTSPVALPYGLVRQESSGANARWKAS
jgi:Protein of unknown function (DUF5131)